MTERERKLRKLMGGGDGSSGIATTGSFEYFECSRYIWWANRQESLTKSDHKFMTKRMAKGLYSPLAWRCSTWRSQSGATTTLKPTSTFKRAVYDA